MRIAVLLVALIILVPLTGCFSGDDAIASEQTSQEAYPNIYDRKNLDWEWNGSYSMVLEKGPYTALEVQEAFIEVDTSEIWETGPPTSDVHLSYWLPSNTELGEKVPVIAIVGR
mgnify:FL=1